MREEQQLEFEKGLWSEDKFDSELVTTHIGQVGVAFLLDRLALLSDKVRLVRPMCLIGLTETL
jgi:hypothetical protein